LIEVIITITFVAMTYGKVSLWLWKSLENLGNFCENFSATFVPSLLSDHCTCFACRNISLLWCVCNEWQLHWSCLCHHCRQWQRQVPSDCWTWPASGRNTAFHSLRNIARWKTPLPAPW